MLDCNKIIEISSILISARSSSLKIRQYACDPNKTDYCESYLYAANEMQFSRLSGQLYFLLNLLENCYYTDVIDR